MYIAHTKSRQEIRNFLKMMNYLLLLGPCMVLLIFFIKLCCGRNNDSHTHNTFNEGSRHILPESKKTDPYTLDLHGHTLRDAKRTLPDFLDDQFKSRDSVFIITGRGVHSKNEPVIKKYVKSYLKDYGYRHYWEDHGGRVIVFDNIKN